MRKSKRDLLVLVFVLSACASSPAPTPDSSSNPPTLNFNYIALGDSLTMGVQDSTVNEFTQPHSYAAVIARQISSVYGTSFTLPLLSVDGTRENPDQIPTILGISGEDSFSLLSNKTSVTSLSAQNSLEDKTLFPIADGNHRNAPTSQLDAALWLAEKWKNSDPSLPKIITLWIGNNDILGSIVQVGHENYTQDAILAALTSPDDFRNNIRQAFEALKGTGAHIFVGNIPNIAEIAYLVRPALVERWTGRQIPQEKVPAGGKISLPAALNLLADFRAGKDWEQSLEDHLNDASVMSPEELSLISDRITALNGVLDELISEFGFVKVELNEALRSPKTMDGILFTNDWGAGNFFSLDGVHFSHTGHVYTANLFIQAINLALNASIPPVPIGPTWEQDPYHDQDHDGFPPGPNYDPPDGIVQLLFSFRDPDDQNPAVSFGDGTKAMTKEIQAAFRSRIRRGL